MITAWPLLLLLLAVEDAAVIGAVRVVGPAHQRSITLTVDGKDTALTGDLVAELGRLGAAKVEVLGHMEGAVLRVQGYRILDVGGGAKPLVGTLLAVADNGLALADGEGGPVPLSLDATGKARLLTKVGAKIWVFGKKLLSGELRVARYGILKEAVSSSP